MKNRGLLRYGGFLFSATAARIASILITSVTFPYLVRILGVETYGLWSYVVAISAFLEIVADPGLTTHITRRSPPSGTMPASCCRTTLRCGCAVR